MAAAVALNFASSLSCADLSDNSSSYFDQTPISELSSISPVSSPDFSFDHNLLSDDSIDNIQVSWKEEFFGN